jgi:general secretion pathway protein C
MGLDTFLKRWFPAVVCLLIGVAAYFQASGIGQLVAGSIALDPSSVPAAAPAPHIAAAAPASTDHATSADPIIHRNPFDSITGPLDSQELELPGNTPPPPMENTDPYQDPPCDVAKVLLITASDDPAWSFAAIAGSDGNPILRRQGDDVGGHKVWFIGWDRVWLEQNGSRCQMEVGGKTEVKKAPVAQVEKKPTGRASRSKVPEEIASKIHKVSDTEFNVERSVVDQILENQAELMRSARIVPEKEGDKIVGIRLFGIKPDSLLGTLGLENGDRLSSINGFDMASPEKALEAYARLRTADHLTVAINRKGKPTNIDFNIK